MLPLHYRRSGSLSSAGTDTPEEEQIKDRLIVGSHLIRHPGSPIALEFSLPIMSRTTLLYSPFIKGLLPVWGCNTKFGTMIQMIYLDNFNVLQHFLPEIHLVIMLSVGIRTIMFFCIKVIRIQVKSFEQLKLKL